MTRARQLAELRCSIIDPRPLTLAERVRRAELYLIAIAGASWWTQARSQLITWHLDKVDRASVAVHVEHALRVRREHEQRTGRHRIRGD